MKPIFLIGYMATGKTTLGHALAARTGMRFVDLDDEVEHMAGVTIGEIFELHGQEAFRVMEREALCRLAGCRDVIVACGGGTPCYFDNMDVMNAAGITVWLSASPDRLMRRLVEGKASRPLIAELSDDGIAALVDRHIRERSPWYARAAERFDSSLLETPAEIESTCRRFIENIIDKKSDD